MIRRITNPRSLQSQMGARIENVDSRQIQVRPDNPRVLTRPGNKVTITLDAFETSHVNFEDSVIWFKTRMVYPDIWQYEEESLGSFAPEDINWQRSFFTPKILALGGASFISRFQIFSGSSELQDYDHYNILYGTLHAMIQIRHTPDPDTLMGVSHLNVPYCREFSYEGETSRVSMWYWVKTPLISVLNAAGNIPLSNRRETLRLIFTLGTADEVFKQMFLTPGDYIGDHHASLTYFDILPKMFLEPSYANPVEARALPYDMSWEMGDVVLQIHGVNIPDSDIENEDEEDIEIFTTSYTTMTAPTSGAMEERLRFQISKGSINGLHAVMVNPDYNTTQGAGDCGIDQWCRAGTLGAVSGYDPSIVWWAIEIGGRKYPTDTGAGDKVPPLRDSNTHMWHHEYMRYNHRNSIGGSIYPPMLQPFDESSSAFSNGLFPPMASFYDEFSTTSTFQMKIADVPSAPAFNLMSITPTYYGMTESLYGGVCTRSGGYVLTSNNVPGSSVDDWYFFTPSALTGGKFIMTCAFTPVDKNPQLIQGISTDRYSIDLLLRRQEPIDTTRTVPTSDSVTKHIRPLVALYEKTPIVMVFIRHKIRLTIGPSSITMFD